MKSAMIAITTIYLIALNPSHAYAENLANKTIVENKSILNPTEQILDYINTKLVQAGFSEDTRKYILATWKQQIASSSTPPVFDRELIDKNIYIFIKNVRVNDPKSSELILKELDQANQYEKPWDHLIADQQLELLKSNSVFNNVTPLSAQAAIKSMGSLFPFWDDSPKPKKKRQKEKE